MRLTMLLAALAASGAIAATTSDGEAVGHSVADPYDPASLNESAMDAVREGDLETAWILLERAARIAPYDRRVARNLRALEARRTGARAPDEQEAPPAQGPKPPQSAPPIVPPEPPALWPPKR